MSPLNVTWTPSSAVRPSWANLFRISASSYCRMSRTPTLSRSTIARPTNRLRNAAA
ncbi:Uncharacterised protein [Mycobacteroides abscessus subsp. abscessus]|nr:Uncharacterised protein [Mycobacteroides abscessus subsp. abscessus]